ncbi:MAG: transcription elongation factor GreB [Methylotenera sp.]|jgi:transcription elongation factor GreB|nr:transcription elongation factor GreB [Methylotenera sp.]MDP1754469.1 transcription elongation factor GreB [Methylotenera sp.]MDP1959168.1 transcription elongation factor GreB [Methylotenera sp.]MDP3303823.1 transcription elongation factor GreB [Methylotenera sp.]MDP3943040.1 transcription elongation factor GreB [Methylotenera sp.]
MAATDEKNYITPDGFTALKAEFHQLYKIERPEVVRTVSWAASNGDRSENGDYIYGKRRLRQIDSRCRHLMRRMDLAEIVDASAQQHLEKIYFGAWVTLFNLDDETEHVYRIVGKDELEPGKGYISWVSPLAKSMLGKAVGDTVRATTPKGEESFEVIDVRYV